MFTRDMTFTDVERLDRIAAEAVETFVMDEDAFRAFYDRTARSVWSYLARITGDRSLADDLLQESYYRFLRAERAFTSESHRRNYLFRIATNLAHDRHAEAPRARNALAGVRTGLLARRDCRITGSSKEQHQDPAVPRAAAAR